MDEFAFIISSEAYKNHIVTEGFYTLMIGGALMSMIVLPIILRVVCRDTDVIIDGSVSHVRYFMSGFYNARNDICNKIEALPNIDDIIRRNLKTLMCVIFIIIIEIVFSGLMTP